MKWFQNDNQDKTNGHWMNKIKHNLNNTQPRERNIWSPKIVSRKLTSGIEKPFTILKRENVDNKARGLSNTVKNLRVGREKQLASISPNMKLRCQKNKIKSLGLSDQSYKANTTVSSKVDKGKSLS